MPKSKNKEKTAFLLAAYGAVFFQAGTDLSAAIWDDVVVRIKSDQFPMFMIDYVLSLGVGWEQ